MKIEKGSNTRNLIILSGPSCVGKTPLLDALEKHYQNIHFLRPVFYTSREPRPCEQEGVHYFFRSVEEIKNMPPEKFAIAKTRQNWQALNMNILLKSDKLIIIDTHPKLARIIEEHPLMRHSNLMVSRIFMQPNTLEEIDQVAVEMQCSHQQAFAAMRTPHLISRAIKQGKELLPPVLSDIQVRVNAAWEELLIGQRYDYIIINHDGEDSDHWLKEPPIGDAGETLKTFVHILRTIDIK